MPTIEKSIDVDRSLTVVYRQWARFEDYPSFMSEIVGVIRIATGLLRLRIELGGKVVNIDVAITEQVPHRRISWASRGREGYGGRVKLQALPGDATRVMLQLTYSRDHLPREADALETVRSLVRDDLKRFKKLVERRRNRHR